MRPDHWFVDGQRRSEMPVHEKRKSAPADVGVAVVHSRSACEAPTAMVAVVALPSDLVRAGENAHIAIILATSDPDNQRRVVANVRNLKTREVVASLSATVDVYENT